MGTASPGCKLGGADLEGERFYHGHLSISFFDLERWWAVRHSRDRPVLCRRGRHPSRPAPSTPPASPALADYEMRRSRPGYDREAARLARAVADRWTARTQRTARFVAGGTGPRQPYRLHLAGRETIRSRKRNVTYDELVAAYARSRPTPTHRGGAPFHHPAIQDVTEPLSASRPAAAAGGPGVRGLGYSHRLVMISGVPDATCTPYHYSGH